MSSAKVMVQSAKFDFHYVKTFAEFTLLYFICLEFDKA